MDRKKFILSQMIKVKPIIEKEGIVIHYKSKPKGELYNIVEPIDFASGLSKKGVRLRNSGIKTNQIRFSK